MNQQQSVSFKLSGKCPPQSFLFAGIAIFIAVTAMGALYGAAIHYCPLIYINFILTLLFGFGIALVLCKMLQLGKMRNLKVAGIIGLIAGLWGVYCSWVMKIFILSEFEAIVIHPSQLFNVLTFIASKGAWEVFGWVPTGVALWSIWGIEALTIIGFATYFLMLFLDQIFCEACNRWVGSEEEANQYYDDLDENELKALVTTITHGNPLELKTLPPRKEGKNTYLKAHTSGCKSCQALNFLTLSKIVLSQNDKGEISTDKETLVNRIFLKPSEFEALREGLSAD